MRILFVIPALVLLTTIFVQHPVFAASEQHTFTFSYHHNFGVPGGGAAFNVWQGNGNFKDGILTGKGFASATYSDRGQKTILEMKFSLSEPYELDASGNKLTANAYVESSTMPSFPAGTTFKIVIEKGNKPSTGVVCYVLPSESGCQGPATVVIN